MNVENDSLHESNGVAVQALTSRGVALRKAIS